MLLCYVRYQEVNLMSRMVSQLALADLCFAIGNLLGDAGTYGSVNGFQIACYVQGIMRAWGAICSMFLSAAIAFVLHIKVLRPTSNYFRDVDPYGAKLATFCWVFSFVLSIGPVFTRSYGEVGGFCWIVNTNDVNVTWRYAQVYFWMFLTVIYCAIVWFAISRKLRALSPDMGSETERRAIASKLVWYPLILVITRFPGLIERLLDTIGHMSFFWLSVTHTTLSNSNGWLNAIVYGMTPFIKLRIKEDILSCCSNVGFIETISGNINDDSDSSSSFSRLTGGNGTLTNFATINTTMQDTITETPTDEEEDAF